MENREALAKTYVLKSSMVTHLHSVLKQYTRHSISKRTINIRTFFAITTSYFSSETSSVLPRDAFTM